MKTITITLKNEAPSTVAHILDTAEGHTVVISNMSLDGEMNVLQTRFYSTSAAAEKFVTSYKNEKQRAFDANELIDGVTIAA